MHKNLIIARWVLGGVLSLATCLHPASAGEEDHLGKSQGPLVSTTVVTAAQQESLGLLGMRSNLGGCSATLLNNSWVVSASHCLNATDMRNPGGVTLTATWATAQNGTPDYIYRFWGVDTQGSTYDISLLHLNAPVRINGSTTGYVRDLSEYSLNDMNTVNVAVYGRGINVLAANTPAGPKPTSTDGLFRSAVFTVNRIEPTLYWYPKTAANETVGSGDSGGPSFEMSHGIPRIAGVHALCHTTCLKGQSCPASNPWMWVSDITECADAPVGYLGGAIQDIITQTWNPSTPVQTVQVRHSEGQVQKEMLLGQLDTLPWDYVRRAAQRNCMNRGFVSGFSDGNYQANERYQMRCVSSGAGRWYDALPPQMARINDKFQYIAQIGWAQGARAANDLCKVIDPNTVGGVLTGFEATTPPGSQFFDQKVGVFCFNNTNATWFDSTLAELSAQGTAVGDLNAIGWAPASRAANEYCRRKFYPAGGFFNGHQLDDKRGVVCLGKNSVMSDRVTATDDYRAARTSAATAANTTATSGISSGALVTNSVAASRSTGFAAALGVQQPAVPVTPAPAFTTFYTIEADGTLTEYRHNNPESGDAPGKLAASSSAWNTYDAAIPAGGNHLYGRAQNGDLMWFQYDGVNDGANTWRGPVKVGNGWQSFTQIFGGGNGVIYAIETDGSLMWYRHTGFATGDANAWLGPRKIGTGWNSFKTVFSSGEGVIYAVTADGKLMVYHHLDPMNGEMRWSGPTQVGTGWQGFAQVFSTGNGVIYGLATDGKLSYYRHITWNAATPTFKWVGPVAAGQGFDPAARIVPTLP